MDKSLFFLLVLWGASITNSCTKPDPKVSPQSEKFYFPPIGNGEWEKASAKAMGWDTVALNDLYLLLESKDTKAFIILKDGKIVAEKYFGTFKQDSWWYWASAGKTLTGFLVGIAQAEGILNIDDQTSKYLGKGWTSLPLEKENLITVKNQLTMTTGLDDGTGDVDCTLPACLKYKADAGTRWSYHNAPYTLLDQVVQKASGLTYNDYFQQKIRNRIGMKGFWRKDPDANNVFFSDALSMARFGLLMLNKGKWGDTVILKGEAYFNAQTNTSQKFNLSYGYLTWLNGKSSYMLPQTQRTFPGPMIPNAPDDLYQAFGKNDQKIYVLPSQNLVVIRMGEKTSDALLSDFDNELWGKLKVIIK
ncbi:serine hydrolase domain-containing protein [Persicitalea sp.]|uniref:serine hydrolase domain-containing protein n=1 Tax=Persicitalea sp. TaxID=3100273 RepID=UPI0035934E1A